MGFREERRFEEFLRLLTKLEPVEYLGICKILEVPLNDGENARGFDETLREVMDKFEIMKKKPRHQLMSMLRDLTRSDKHGIGA